MLSESSEYYSQDVKIAIGPLSRLRREDLWLEINAAIRKTSVKNVCVFLEKARAKELNELQIILENFTGLEKSEYECQSAISELFDKIDKLLSKFRSLKGTISYNNVFYLQAKKLEVINAWYNTTALLKYMERTHGMIESDKAISSLVSNILSNFRQIKLIQNYSVRYSVAAIAKINSSIDEFRGAWQVIGLPIPETADAIGFSMLNAINEHLSEISYVLPSDDSTQRKVIGEMWQLMIDSSNMHSALITMLNGRKIPEVFRNSSMTHVHCFMKLIHEYALPNGILDIQQYLARQNDYRHWSDWDEIHDGLEGSDLIMSLSFGRLISEILRLFAAEIDRKIAELWDSSCMTDEVLIQMLSQFREMGTRVLNGRHGAARSYDNCFRYRLCKELIVTAIERYGQRFVRIVPADGCSDNGIVVLAPIEAVQNQREFSRRLRRIPFNKQEIDTVNAAWLYHNRPDEFPVWPGSQIKIVDPEVSDSIFEDRYDPEWAYFICRNYSSIKKIYSLHKTRFMDEFGVYVPVPSNIALHERMITVDANLNSVAAALVRASIITASWCTESNKDSILSLFSFTATFVTSTLQVSRVKSFDDVVKGIPDFLKIWKDLANKHDRVASKLHLRNFKNSLIDACESSLLNPSIIDSLPHDHSEEIDVDGVNSCEKTPSKTKERPLAQLALLEQQKLASLQAQKLVGRIVDSKEKYYECTIPVELKPKFRWQMISQLGVGRLGPVFEALNSETDVVVAVKKIEAKRGQCDFTESFVQEIKRVLHIDHPNLCRYFGMEKKLENVYLVYEFCGGGSLQTHLLLGPVVDPILLRKYASEILQGLAHLHELGLVHRDIQPKNVMIHTSGSVKLKNLGRKQILQSATCSPERVYTVGSPVYMAPEIIIGGKYSAKSDIYSFCCTMLHLATGRRPWHDAKNDWRVVYRCGTLGEVPVVPQKLAERVSLDFHDFVSSGIKRQSESRPSAMELLNHPFLT